MPSGDTSNLSPSDLPTDHVSLVFLDTFEPGGKSCRWHRRTWLQRRPPGFSAFDRLGEPWGDPKAEVQPSSPEMETSSEA